MFESEQSIRAFSAPAAISAAQADDSSSGGALCFSIQALVALLATAAISSFKVEPSRNLQSFLNTSK